MSIWFSVSSSFSSYLPPVSQSIQIRRTRHAGHCWSSKDGLISDVLRWTPMHELTSGGQPTKTYIYQPTADTGCSLDDLHGAMDDKVWWGERERERERESQGTPCYQHDLMIIYMCVCVCVCVCVSVCVCVCILYIYIYICIYIYLKKNKKPVISAL